MLATSPLASPVFVTATPFSASPVPVTTTPPFTEEQGIAPLPSVGDILVGNTSPAAAAAAGRTDTSPMRGVTPILPPNPLFPFTLLELEEATVPEIPETEGDTIVISADVALSMANQFSLLSNAVRAAIVLLQQLYSREFFNTQMNNITGWDETMSVEQVIHNLDHWKNQIVAFDAMQRQLIDLAFAHDGITVNDIADPLIHPTQNTQSVILAFSIAMEVIRVLSVLHEALKPMIELFYTGAIRRELSFATITYNDLYRYNSTIGSLLYRIRNSLQNLFSCSNVKEVWSRRLSPSDQLLMATLSPNQLLQSRWEHVTRDTLRQYLQTRSSIMSRFGERGGTHGSITYLAMVLFYHLVRHLDQVMAILEHGGGMDVSEYWRHVEQQEQYLLHLRLIETFMQRIIEDCDLLNAIHRREQPEMFGNFGLDQS